MTSTKTHAKSGCRFETLAVAIALAAALAGCGGSDPPPIITSFVATPAAVQAGAAAELSAVFSGGSGVIDPGIGPVTSGATVRVTPADDTTYTLTVSGSSGRTATADTDVRIVFDTRWDFSAGASGWVLAGAAATENGRLSLTTTLGSSPPDLPPMQGCSGSRATTELSDARLLAGRYSRVTYTIEGYFMRGSSGFFRDVRIHHLGRGVRFSPLDVVVSATLSVEWVGADDVRLLVGGAAPVLLPTSASTSGEKIELEIFDCPSPGNSARNGAWEIDAVAVSAR